MTPQAEVGLPQSRSRQPQPVPRPPRYRQRRVTFVYPLLVQRMDQPQETLRAHASNLSLGGMFVYTLQPPRPGTHVRIALEVRGKALLLAEGEVRWVRGSAFKAYPWCPGFGVRFTHIPPKAVALVHHLVTRAGGGGLPAPAPVPVPDPFPELPKITELDAPLGEQGFKTGLMFPTLAREEQRLPLPALEEQARPSGGGAWRWVRWGLAVAAVAGWLAAFSQMKVGDTLRAAVARSSRPVASPQR
ncbi:MAG TPA: PilZ domain-containing protein [Myxococcaceae bacterium]